jgi:predicted  nucleic acid-binding Zn-ribbon protein
MPLQAAAKGAQRMTLQERLYQLFLLDKQVRGIRKQLDAATNRHAKQHELLDQVKRQENELKQQIQQGQVKASSFESQGSDAEQRIEELRERMNNVTNNKEYSALLVEMNTLKVDMGKVEEEALEQMSRVELLQQEMKLLAEKDADRQKVVDAAEAEVTECRGRIGHQLDELETQRTAASEDIPPDTLKMFMRLGEYADGEAMAQLNEESRRSMSYTCGGCFMSVPVEHVNTLLVRHDEVVCCTSCGRILYIAEALKMSFVEK